MADDLLHYLIDTASIEEDIENSLELTVSAESTNKNYADYSDSVDKTTRLRSISSDYKALQNGFQNADIEIDLGGRDSALLSGHVLYDYPDDDLDSTAGDIIKIEQPSKTANLKYPKLKKARMKTRKCVEHLAVRLVGVCLVVIDIIFVIVDIIVNPDNPAAIEAYDIISISIWCYFLIEITLRIFAKGKKFFKSKLDWLDLFIVTVTGTVTIVEVTVELIGNYAKLVVIFRVMRIFLLVRLLSERKHVSKATRKMVSQNKRRYRVDDFDLDLTYITDRVIASSFPSSGSQALYRNPIEEVARFLDTKHPDHYKVYNLCIERHYDEAFFHHRVGRVLIYDHNVPKLKSIVEFCADARTWMEMDVSNVLFIHCKGGKGRTGVIVCAWLLETGLFTTAAECLDYFGVRRTDYTEGDMYQGVDTPSQSRYVDYFEKVKYKLNGVIPPAVPLVVTSVRISGINGLGKGDARDFTMEVHYDETSVFVCDFALSSHCVVVYDFETDTAIVQIKDSPEISGDVKIKFISSSKKVPQAYDDCAFFFWFYTGLIEDNRLHLHRKDLDNPHKAETWKVYKEAFAVDVRFSPLQESEA